MLVLDDETVCSNDCCARRFNLGWDGICDDCATMAQDHANELHTELRIECRDCF